MRRTILWSVLLITAVATTSEPAIACQGSCFGTGFGGCANPGADCHDSQTGCGVCRDLLPILGPCVCDPVGSAPFDSWGATGPYGLIEDMFFPLGSSPWDLLAGDQLCAQQAAPVRVQHTYGPAWGVVMPDAIIDRL